jgi:hypothetical protein
MYRGAVLKPHQEIDTMKQLIALGTLLFTLNAAAGCPSAIPTQTPEIPNGSAANEQAMREAMTAVRSYVRSIESFLDCRDATLSDREYDELVDRASAAADAYNRELQHFQQHDKVVAQY